MCRLADRPRTAANQPAPRRGWRGCHGLGLRVRQAALPGSCSRWSPSDNSLNCPDRRYVNMGILDPGDRRRHPQATEPAHSADFARSGPARPRHLEAANATCGNGPLALPGAKYSHRHDDDRRPHRLATAPAGLGGTSREPGEIRPRTSAPARARSTIRHHPIGSRPASLKSRTGGRQGRLPGSRHDEVGVLRRVEVQEVPTFARHECAGELRQDRQGNVQPDPVNAPHPKQQQGPSVLNLPNSAPAAVLPGLGARFTRAARRGARPAGARCPRCATARIPG